MSSKKKAGSTKSPQVVETVKKKETMTYHAFFQSCLVRGWLKSWQEKEVHTFFRSLGLSDKETLDQYRDALSKY